MQQQVSLTISCVNLPRADGASLSDPFCELISFESKREQSLGRTETIRNTKHPVFTKEFCIAYKFETEQNFAIKVFDNDFGESQDEALGIVEFKLGTLMGSRGQRLALDMLPLLRRQQMFGSSSGGSKVIVQAEPVNNADEVLTLELQGRGLDAKDGFIFGKADPYFELVVRRATGESTVVYRSEYVKQNLNPKWKPLQIPMSRLTQPGTVLRLTVTDWDEHTKHDLIGHCDITVNDLLQRRRGLQLIHPPTKSKYSSASYKNSGLLDVVECRAERVYSFIDFLRGGLALQLQIAVDFTGSNGNPNQPGTLHYGAGRFSNQYLEAIQAVGNICLEYDADKMVQAFGFGAKPSQWEQQVSHCFPLAGTGQSEYVHGIDGVLQAYTNCFERGIVLFGPTNFAPVIRRCTQIAQQAAAQNHQSYSILLIVTDGEITDMQETMDAIVYSAANAPMSIVIVGVGAADFTSMSRLDADRNPIVSSRGEACARDIVQFVPFNQFHGNAEALSQETLREIPQQVTDYFKMRGIAPLPAIELPLETATAAVNVVRQPPPPINGGYRGVPPPPIDNAYRGVPPPPIDNAYRGVPPPPTSQYQQQANMGRNLFQGAF